MAELVQPRIAWKMPQPPLLGTLGLQHYLGVIVSMDVPLLSFLCLLDALLTLTCHTTLSISYDPGPEPSSEASLPTILFHFPCSRDQTARENRPAPTRYSKQVDATRKYCSFVDEPPL